jgi:hypothetical protein
MFVGVNNASADWGNPPPFAAYVGESGIGTSSKFGSVRPLPALARQKEEMLHGAHFDEDRAGPNGTAELGFSGSRSKVQALHPGNFARELVPPACHFPNREFILIMKGCYRVRGELSGPLDQ